MKKETKMSREELTMDNGQLTNDNSQLEKDDVQSLSKGWRKAYWKDVLEIRSGRDYKAVLEDNGKYPIIGSAGKVMAYANDYICEEGTTIIGRKGTINNPMLIKERFWNVDTAFGLHAQDELNKRFLYYFCLSFDFTKMDRGSGRPSLVKSDLLKIKMIIPPLHEQQRIVSILDEAFAAINKAKANAEKNLKNAKELFESYLQGVFSEIFLSNATKAIKELAEVVGGYSFKSKDFKKEGEYQVLRMGNVRPGIVRENENPVFIDNLDEKVLSRALLQLNDVIITQTGTKQKRDYGFTVIIQKPNYLLNQRIAAIRFSESYLPKFFLYFSWTDLFKDQYFANETGTVGQGNVGIKAITDSNVPFISLDQQQKMVEQIDTILAETQKMEAIYKKKIDDLEELKKSILQKAFAGELMSEPLINAD
jgi:type I restriction enzyme S subunit